MTGDDVAHLDVCSSWYDFKSIFRPIIRPIFRLKMDFSEQGELFADGLQADTMRVKHTSKLLWLVISIKR